MKTLTKLTFASALVLIGLVSTAAHANTRLDRIMWTDRGAANPPLSENTSTIDQSIERFWNLPTPDPMLDTSSTPASSYRYSRPTETHAPSTVVKKPNHMIDQQKNQRDKRGYFGINLFNMIPLIDIVTGTSETSSSDHVEASR